MNTEILQTENYINGAFVNAGTKHTIHNKYTQEVIADIAVASMQQVQDAVKSSWNSFPVFKKFSAEKRAGILRNLYRLLQEQGENFAQLIALEAGKPIGYARSEVNRALDNLDTGIRETLMFTGEQVPMDYLNGKNKFAYTLKQPIGPVLGITPFNFPLNLALHKLIPAIAVGAPVIIKPAPQAPLTMLAFAKLIAQTDLPEGAVNILFTTNENTQYMVENDLIKILSFTGSDKIGWMLKGLAPRKKVLLEMGGNAASIIDKHTNIKRIAKKLAYGSFLNAGQICISTQRIYVLENIFSEFIDIFIAETHKIPSGYMLDENVVNSSMISTNDLQRIADWIKEAVKQGAEILTGGTILDENANLFAPTVLTGTDKTMKVNAMEAFAPVVVVEPVKNFSEAIEKINESRYGLQAGVFTNSIENMLLAQAELEVGGVIINDIPGFRIDSMPYGGIKNSGMGREGARYAMEDFTETKLIVVGH